MSSKKFSQRELLHIFIPGGHQMGWYDRYQQKSVTAKEAVEVIKSGDRVLIAHAAAEPTTLVDALVKDHARLEKVEIVHMVPMGKGEYLLPEMKNHFRHNAIFAGGISRLAIAEGRADYTPVFFHEVPKLLRTSLPIDVALIHVSPPDKHGYCSYGISVDYTKPGAEAARIVLAEVNQKMPRTLGDSFIHIDDIDWIVESDKDIINLKRASLGVVEQEIGKHCASLIQDGDTLQLGIGAIPDAVLLSLKDKKNLGIHSEMISDGVMELIQSGIINGKKKSIHNGICVASFLMGTKKLYDFVDNNPMIQLFPVDYVNDPRIILKNDNMISINSAVQVDLMGQVCAETINGLQISGVGGQVDFVRGAAFSNGGKSIIAMPSTAARGTVSRIVPILSKGSAVTTSRNDIDYVVTEYGIAALKGKTLCERANSLINICHPDFRDELRQNH